MPEPGELTNDQIIALYKQQINYLLSELHRIGWTQHPG